MSIKHIIVDLSNGIETAETVKNEDGEVITFDDAGAAEHIRKALKYAIVCGINMQHYTANNK